MCHTESLPHHSSSVPASRLRTCNDVLHPCSSFSACRRRELNGPMGYTPFFFFQQLGILVPNERERQTDRQRGRGSVWRNEDATIYSSSRCMSAQMHGTIYCVVVAVFASSPVFLLPTLADLSPPAQVCLLFCPRAAHPA